jgi:chitinase
VSRRPVLLVVVLLALLTACDTGKVPPPVPAPAPASSTPPADRVVGYFTDWGVYDRGFHVKNLQVSGAAAKLTHLLYAFGDVDGGKCTAGDPWADYEKPVAAADSVNGRADGSSGLRGAFGQLRELKAAHPGLKLIWSFGGWSGSAGFTDAARDPAAFAAGCKALLDDPRWAGLFDGIDIDWEYPNACGLDCDRSGRPALAGLLGALRTALGPKALVTAAVTGDVSKLGAADYAAAARSADWLGAMTYDFFGTTGDGGEGGSESGGPTAEHSPLTAYPGIPEADATATATVDELLRLGVPPAKVLLGVGFYGRGWTGVTRSAPGGTAGGPAAGTYAEGQEDYKVLARRCPPTGTAGGTAYAFCGDQWWSYDTPATIRVKMAFVRQRELGGAFAWELSGDTTQADLLGAMSAGLTRS